MDLKVFTCFSETSMEQEKRRKNGKKKEKNKCSEYFFELFNKDAGSGHTCEAPENLPVV